MDLLARREHSRLELAQKLTPRSANQDILQTALDQLEEDKLLCDARFCEAFIRSRFLKGQGPRRIEMELRQKGVDDTISAHLLEQLDWLNSLRQLIERQYGDNPASDIQSKAKQQRFLQSRGFTYEQIQVAFDQLRQEHINGCQ